jgi:hypothetical protein
MFFDPGSNPGVLNLRPYERIYRQVTCLLTCRQETLTLYESCLMLITFRV